MKIHLPPIQSNLQNFLDMKLAFAEVKKQREIRKEFLYVVSETKLF